MSNKQTTTFINRANKNTNGSNELSGNIVGPQNPISMSYNCY